MSEWVGGDVVTPSKGLLEEFNSFLLPCGLKKSNLGCQALRQAPLCAEPSCQAVFSIMYAEDRTRDSVYARLTLYQLSYVLTPGISFIKSEVHALVISEPPPPHTCYITLRVRSQHVSLEVTVSLNWEAA